MRIRKRYILLILLALLPLTKLIHLDDNYCFGDADLVIIFFMASLFTIAFLVILFFNLYKISLRKELLNYRPLLIAGIYYSLLIILLKYHDKNVFKDLKTKYIHRIDDDTYHELTLFLDGTYQFKNAVFAKNCYYKGAYHLKNDTLYLAPTIFFESSKKIDSIYIVDKKNFTLNPKNKNFLKLEKVKKN